MVRSPQMCVSVTDSCISVTMIADGRILASAEASRLYRDAWYINRVFVRQDRRGQGWGSKVLGELLSRVDADAIVEPGGYGSDPERLRSFYGRHGFQGASAEGQMRWTKALRAKESE